MMWWIICCFLRAFFGPFGSINPGAAGLGGCESLFPHLETEKMIAEKYLVRRFLNIQQALEEGGLGNAYWLSGAENPADGLTMVRSDAAPPCTTPRNWPILSGTASPPQRCGLHGVISPCDAPEFALSVDAKVGRVVVSFCG